MLAARRSPLEDPSTPSEHAGAAGDVVNPENPNAGAGEEH